MAEGFPADARAAAHCLLAHDSVPGACAAFDAIDAGGLELVGDAGHHLQRVRRLEVGERVTVSPGDGRWRLTVVTAAAPGRLHVEPEGPVTHEPRLVPGLAVAFCPGRRRPPEPVVAALTEVGVDRIIPIVADRSSWRPADPAKALVRLRRAAHEAAEQSRRAHSPVVAQPTTPSALSGHPAVVLAARGGGSAPVCSPAGGEWLLAVGPEGGFTDEEREAWAAVATVGVGPFILRAVTAPIVVAGLLSSGRRPEQRA